MEILHRLPALVLFAAAHYAYAALLFVSAYGSGRRLLARVRFGNVCEETAFSAATGIGFFAQAVFLLGLIRQIHAPIVAALVAAGLAFGRREIAQGVTRAAAFLRNSGLATRMWIAAAIAAGAVLMIPALYPPHVWDAMSYHVPSARIYAAQGAVRPTPYLIFCAFTQLNEMLFTAAMLFSDAVAAQCIEMLLMFLALTAVAGAARTIGARPVWAVAALIGIGIVVRMSGTAYIDVGLMLFVTLLLIAFDRWHQTGETSWLLVAGIFAGFAASTKYTADFIILCLGAFLLIDVARRRAWLDLVRFAAPLAAIAVPWYAYIFATTGNPVFPFLSQVFGTGCWTAEDVAHVQRELATLGTPRTFRSLLLLPWNLAFEQEKFFAESPLSVVIFAGLPVWLAAAIFRRQTRVLGVVAFLYTLFWFFAAQIPRYLMPVFPLYALFTAAALTLVTARLPARLTRALVPVIALVLVFPTIRLFIDFAPIGLPPANKVEEEAFFERYPTYECYRWLNTHYGSDYTLYAFDAPFMKFFAHGTRIGDEVGEGRFNDVSPMNGRELRRYLQGHGAEFALFAVEGFRKVFPPTDPAFKAHFVLCATCGTGTLWRMTAHPVRESFGSEMLDDGGFEKTTGARWLIAPTARVDMGATESFSGRGAIRVNPAAIELYQIIPAAPSRRYQFVFRARGEAPAAGARIVVSWFDARHNAIRHDLRDVPVDTAWRRYALTFFSPPGTISATVYPESTTAAVWFDDLSLRLMFYEPGQEPAPIAARTVIGVFRSSDRTFFARHAVTPGFADEVVRMSASGIPVAGDWNADGNLDLGLYDPATGNFRMRRGKSEEIIATQPGAVPVAGDWDGDGRSTFGLFDRRTATFVLYEDAKPVARFSYGRPDDRPIAGDWDGDGLATVGTYRPSTGTFQLRNRNDSGADDQVIRLGSKDDIPVAGDWSSEGKTAVGVFDAKNGAFVLRNSDGSELTLSFGVPGDYGFAGSVNRPAR